MTRARARRLPGCRPALAIAGALIVSLVAVPLPAQFGAIGLSGVGAQRFGNVGFPGAYLPENDDNFGFAFASGDFDGDGAGDLAIGVPSGDIAFGGELEGSGLVIVHYGAVGGRLAEGVPSQLLGQALVGSPDPAESSDSFGSALAACDFNGDGFDDLAVGVPGEDGVPVAVLLDIGAVDVYSGSSLGLTTDGARHLTPVSAGFPAGTAGSERFGSALACGELVDGGPFADLAIGLPGKLLGSATDPRFGAGMVLVARGSATGLSANGSLQIHQDLAGLADAAESFDQFGFALATLDMNGDGFDDLAIGVPGEDNLSSELDGRGAVHLLFGTDFGLAEPNNFLRTESGFNGTSELGDRFGFALAAGDFDGDGFDDLAVGAPFEDFSGATNAGQTIAIYGQADVPFFSFARTQFWNEDTIHFPGATETDDRFGLALAAADFDGDGRADLAIGGPGELHLPGAPNDGMTTVIMGGATGLSNARRHGLAAGYHGNPGAANQANRFYGSAFATGDFDGDGYADLAIGAPGEDEAGLVDIGAAVVLYGSLFADGFEVGNAGFWSDTAP